MSIQIQPRDQNAPIAFGVPSPFGRSQQAFGTQVTDPALLLVLLVPVDGS
jgi:hypothetical protein